MPEGRLTVTMEYSYEVDTADYKALSALCMAQEDFDADPAAVLAFADEWALKAAKFEATNATRKES